MLLPCNRQEGEPDYFVSGAEGGVNGRRRGRDLPTFQSQHRRGAEAALPGIWLRGDRAEVFRDDAFASNWRSEVSEARLARTLLAAAGRNFVPSRSRTSFDPMPESGCWFAPASIGTGHGADRNSEYNP